MFLPLLKSRNGLCQVCARYKAIIWLHGLTDGKMETSEVEKRGSIEVPPKELADGFDLFVCNWRFLVY